MDRSIAAPMDTQSAEFRVRLRRGRPGSRWGIRLAWVFLPTLFALAAETPVHAAPEDPFRWNAFLGPFHMVLLHFPIGFIAAAAGLEVFSWKRPSADLRFSVKTMLWLTFGSGIAASVAGLLRASEGGFDPELVLEHRNFGFAFLATTLASLVGAHLAHRQPQPGKSTLVYRGFLILSLLLVGTAGHHGGSLTHGADFLTHGAPPFLNRLLKPSLQPPPATPLGTAGTSPNGSTNAPAVTGGPPAAGGGVYATTIRPLFESRCYSCHGPEKHKGDYRLDLPENALRGGDSATPAIVPGDPMKSNLLRVLLLPRDHDDVMPPEGKQGVTPEEILAIAHWIQSGAPFDSP